MKFSSTHIFLSTILLTGMLVFAAGCGSATQDGDKSKDTIDTTQVIKVEPQNFPVNALSDSLFGKVVTVSAEKGLKLKTANLTLAPSPLPEWLDQILSRESIVLFANGILATMPDEVEFVQTTSAQYQGPDGWKMFTVNFSTRPSNAAMIVYGAYQNEEKSYWASQSGKDKLDMNPMTIQAVENGVEVWGEWKKEPKGTPFHAILTKNATTISQQ